MTTIQIPGGDSLRLDGDLARGVRSPARARGYRYRIIDLGGPIEVVIDLFDYRGRPTPPTVRDAMIARRALRRRTPVKTGMLRRSLRVFRTFGGFVCTWEVDYAIYPQYRGSSAGYVDRAVRLAMMRLGLSQRRRPPA